MRNFIGIAAAVLFLASAASAAPPGVEIRFNGVGGGLVTGSTTGAKATGGEIGCDAAGTFVWCNAKDAAGNVAGCWSLANAQFVNPMGSTDHCMIMFTFDDTGKCTGLVTRNGSNYLPDPPE